MTAAPRLDTDIAAFPSGAAAMVPEILLLVFCTSTEAEDDDVHSGQSRVPSKIIFFYDANDFCYFWIKLNDDEQCISSVSVSCANSTQAISASVVFFMGLDQSATENL